MATSTTNSTNNNSFQFSYFALTVRPTRVVMLATFLSLILSLTNCTPYSEQVNPDDTIETDTYASPRSSAILDSNATLKSAAPFPIGATPGSWIVRKTKGYALFKSQFSSKTVHAYMNIESIQGSFNFQELDYWVNWAETNPIRLHGHCLVFHRGAPEWILQFKGNTSEFEQIVKNHIQTIVSRYRGKIKGWDVFNEAFTNQGKMDETPFRKLYPSDEAYMRFIKLCFQWAHEMDPDALLFYNDYSCENSPAKLNAILQMVIEFKREGVPIDGIGTQMHISINTANSGIQNSFLRLASTNLLIHISELDIIVNPSNDPTLAINQQLLSKQRSKFQSVASLYKQIIPSHLQYGITLWDFSDADSWIVVQKKKNDAPCIFDADYRKKPAFYGLLSGLIN